MSLSDLFNSNPKYEELVQFFGELTLNDVRGMNGIEDLRKNYLNITGPNSAQQIGHYDHLLSQFIEEFLLEYFPKPSRCEDPKHANLGKEVTDMFGKLTHKYNKDYYTGNCCKRKSNYKSFKRFEGLECKDLTYQCLKWRCGPCLYRKGCWRCNRDKKKSTGHVQTECTYCQLKMCLCQIQVNIFPFKLCSACCEHGYESEDGKLTLEDAFPEGIEEAKEDDVNKLYDSKGHGPKDWYSENIKDTEGPASPDDHILLRDLAAQNEKYQPLIKFFGDLTIGDCHKLSPMDLRDETFFYHSEINGVNVPNSGSLISKYEYLLDLFIREFLLTHIKKVNRCEEDRHFELIEYQSYRKLSVGECACNRDHAYYKASDFVREQFRETYYSCLQWRCGPCLYGGPCWKCQRDNNKTYHQPTKCSLCENDICTCQIQSGCTEYRLCYGCSNSNRFVLPDGTVRTVDGPV